MHKDQLSNTHLENYLLYYLGKVGYKFCFLFFSLWQTLHQGFQNGMSHLKVP